MVHEEPASPTLEKPHCWYRRRAGLAALTLRLRPEHPRVLAVLMSSFSSVVPIERPRHSFTTAIPSSGIDWSMNPNPGSCGLKKRYHAAPTRSEERRVGKECRARVAE